MMLFPLPLRSHFPGKLAGFCCSRVVSLAVISRRGGGRVRDPVEAAFQGRSGHKHVCKFTKCKYRTMDTFIENKQK